jgi:hypothetical protein
MDPIRAELERVYQLVTADAEAAAKARLRQAHLELEEREAALAAAMELASVDPAVRAAFNDGIADERYRVLALIQQQIDTLSRGAISHTVLHTLRRAVEGEP